MAQDRDERLLSDIHFAQDLSEPLRTADEKRVRYLFGLAGAIIGQDIVELGCTGLVLKLVEKDPGGAVGLASYMRVRMSGSICGLPCYVPRNRYCLVHDTIGGLQEAGNLDGPQAQRHPEALPLMSRELTEEEHKKVLGVAAKISEEGRKAALAEYGAEDIGDDLNFGSSTPAPSCPIPQPPFKCPDHKEPDWTCRKCIAQAIVESRAPVCDIVRVYVANVDMTGHRDSIQASLDEALRELASGDGMPVELWARVASWSKKVSRD